ncbi:MAG: ABC transporter ATP-binding protein [Candidatus Nucleicultricaceae bacterium]
MGYKDILSFFWKHIKPYKWYYAVMLIAPVGGSFYPFAYNYSVKLFIDTMVGDATVGFGGLMKPIALFLFTQFMLDAVWRVSNIAEWLSEPYVRRSILLNTYDYVQHHSYRYFQDNFTGAISSKLKSILDGYDKFWAEMHHGLLQRLIKCIVNLTVLAVVNVYLGLFILLWSAIYLPVLYALSVKLNTLSFEETESRHSLIGDIADKITNIISIFSFAARPRELKTLDQKISNDFIPRQVKTYKYDFKIQMVGGFLYWLLFGFILFYMIHLKTKGLVSIGDFAFVLGIALIVAEDVWHATISLQDFSRSMGDLKSALTVIQTPHEHEENPNATELQINHPTIEFRDVSFAYQSHHAVFTHLNLSIQAGEKIGIVGHSGSGKSSLINLLLGYFKPQDGQILVDQQNIEDVTRDSLRKNIAIIPQDTLLFHRTLMENIRFGRYGASDAEVIAASKKAHVHEFIESIPEQYQAFVGERGIKLSGGQRQRIAIARAILKDAPILILDEATSALDSETEKLIQESLNLLINDKQKTVIAIAHRLSTLKHMDRIIVLDAGRIVEEGKHTTLLHKTNSVYKKLWELQAI